MCGGPLNLKRALSAVSVEDIVAFFGPKVEDGALGKGLNIAFDQIAALTGLAKIIDGDGNQKILDELNVINEKLDGISDRLDQGAGSSPGRSRKSSPS